MPPELDVVGSVNLDLVARCERLPRVGETLTDATFARYPGGKGANQAVAAARLGARVSFVGAVGEDAFADEALAGMREAGVDFQLGLGDATGVAVILVDAEGENVIVVAPGANAQVGRVETGGNVLAQLEVADETVVSAAESAERFFLNAAPARPIPAEVVRAAELVVVNRYELDSLPETPSLLALTLGEEGAVLIEDGQEVVRAAAPRVDGGRRHGRRRRVHRVPRRLAARGARPRGGAAPCLRRGRDRGVTRRRAAVAADRGGGRCDASGMSIPILLDCDPGHDDAIALLLALGSDELELRGVTTVAGNQTLEKTTANAIRVLELAGRAEIPVAAGAGRPLVREPRVAADVHGETGLDGPDLPPPHADPSPQHAVDFLAERRRRRDARRHRPADERRAAAGPLPGGEAGADRADGRRDRRGQRHARGRVQHLGRPRGRAARLHERARRDDGRARRHPPGARRRRRTTAQLRAGRIGAVVAELLEFYGGFHRSVYGWDGSPIHDAVAVAHVIDPELLELERLNVRIDTESELCRGRTVVDLWRRTGLEPTANVAVGIDSDGFVDLLLQRLARLG